MQNLINSVEVKITFSDGTSKIFSEYDIQGDFLEWLSNVNYDKNERRLDYENL